MIFGYPSGGCARDGQRDPETERKLAEQARAGLLRTYLIENPEPANAAVYAVISDLVYRYLTRPAERRRGHSRCASRIDRLEPDCRERHQDDVEAVHADLLAHADRRITNLHGWLTSRLRAVTIDAHRRRRGDRGALQRPRLPVWLARELGENDWLRTLALNILDWVGETATAGPDSPWPLRTWAEQRTGYVPGPQLSEARLNTEVERVLTAMRRRPAWYEAHVERPLGLKPAALLPARREDAEPPREPAPVRLVEPDEIEHALLSELAAAAIERIERRLAAGAPTRQTVAEVLRLVFTAGTGAEEMDRMPDGGRHPSPRERAAQLVLEPEVLDRVVDAVLRIIAANRREAVRQNNPDQRAGRNR